jgi:hypothetical protein
MASVAAVAAADAQQASRFELRYRDVDEVGFVECHGALGVCWSTRFEDVPPVRRFPSYQGQRSFSGCYFAACMGRHVGFESWLKRDQLIMLDFSPQVEAFAAQPFWLVWSAGGRVRRHAPDFFARLTDGRGVVVDVRADDRIAPEDHRTQATRPHPRTDAAPTLPRTADRPDPRGLCDHLPATFVYAGIDVERRLFTGVRGKQIAGRCVLINTGPFPCDAEWKGPYAPNAMDNPPDGHPPCRWRRGREHRRGRRGGRGGCGGGR